MTTIDLTDGFARVARPAMERAGKDPASEADVRAFAARVEPVACGAFDATGRRLALGLRGLVQLFDAETGARLQEFTTDRGDRRSDGTPAFEEHALEFAPDGERLVAVVATRASEHGTHWQVQAFDVARGGDPRLVLYSPMDEPAGEQLANGCTTLAISDDGRWLAASSHAQGSVVVELATGRAVLHFASWLDDAPAYGLAFDPTGRRLAALAHGALVVGSIPDGEVVSRRVVSWEWPHEPDGHPWGCARLVFPADDHVVFADGFRRRPALLRRFGLRDATLDATWDGPMGKCLVESMEPDGTVIWRLSPSERVARRYRQRPEEGGLVLLGSRARGSRRRLPPPGAVSPDGSRVARWKGLRATVSRARRRAKG